MLVELGWAFFCRMDAALEALIGNLGIPGKDVLTRLSRCGFSSEDLERYGEARELRHIIHHGDGDPALLRSAPAHVHVAPGKQPHLYPQHIERLYEVYLKAGNCLSRAHARIM